MDGKSPVTRNGQKGQNGPNSKMAQRPKGAQKAKRQKWPKDKTRKNGKMSIRA